MKELKIIKAVKKNKYLTDEEKSDVIQRLSRIMNDPVESEESWYDDDEKIVGCIIWDYTKDGWDYWNRISKIMGGRR